MTAVTAYASIFAATFLVVGLAALLTWAFVERPVVADDANDAGILRRDRLSALSLLTVLLGKLRFTDSAKRLLSEAQVNWTVGRLVLTMLVVASLVLAVFTRIDFVPWWGAAPVAAAIGCLPLLWLRNRRERRMRRVEEQLPEALDFVSRALVAGHSLPMSLELLADDIGPPLASELRKTVDEYNVGASMGQALENLALRVPSVDIQFFASAIMTQTRTGGGLHEVLENLADTIRERGTLKGQVRALTANGRMTAIVLSLLPVFIGCIMLVMNADYFMVLIDHPIGKTLLFLAACSQAAAYFVIQRIVDIKV